MVTLERVSQIFEKIHCHKTQEENCIYQDDQPVDLEEKVLQVARIFKKVAIQIEDNWQNYSTEDTEIYKQVYCDLKPLVENIRQETEAGTGNTDTGKILCSSLEYLMSTLVDAIEFECISSEVSDASSTPFTDEEIEKADAAIARLTTEVNSQRYSPEEIWERFDAVRDRITSSAKPQNS
jgi:hypothetical protein